ncbi:MAG: helix-turn-helix domain-containing protein [Phycisphaerales bacterium]|nr:helix-turn-helix domain-containing protein [Phycisphaerales bacterium]
MIDPRIIPPGEVLRPMDLGERPAHRNGRAPTDAEQHLKRKPRGGGGAVRRRFALLNGFVDCELARLGAVAAAVWLVLYRHGQRDGTATAAVSDLARRTGYADRAVRQALRRLRDRGLIDRVKRGTLASGPSVYRLLMPSGVAP